MVSSHPVLAWWTHAAVYALQAVSVRPPPGSLRRGLFALPRTVTAVTLALAVVALLALALRDRLRRRRETP